MEADPLEKLEERFHAAHEQRYGYRMDDEPVELVNLRLIATVPVEKPGLDEPAAEDEAVSERREANFDGEWLEVPVYDRESMGEGSEVEGPAIVEFKESTCVVRPGWRGPWTAWERWYWRGNERNEAGPGNALGAGERSGGHSRGDGGGPDPGLLLLEHKGAARLLDRPLRRERQNGRPGRAHPRPPRGDAGGGRSHNAQRPRAGGRLRH